MESVSSLNVTPNPKQKVLCLLKHDESALSCVISTTSILSLCLIIIHNLLCSQLSVHIHVFKHIGSYIIKFSTFNLAELLCIHLAPIQQLCIVLS